MELIGELKHILLGFAMIVMAVALLLSLIRAMAGPRFTDRIVAINMIGTQAILLICILSYMIGEQYLVDVALVYAMISFLAVVALVHIYLSMLHEKVAELKAAQEFESREHEIEVGAQPETSDVEEKVATADTPTARDIMEATEAARSSGVEETAAENIPEEAAEDSGEDDFFDEEETSESLMPGDTLLGTRAGRKESGDHGA